MPFVGIGDVAKCASLALKTYQYGWSKVRNASAQYNEFGQDVYSLHQNLKRLDNVFQSVKSSAQGPIPDESAFFDTDSLNDILDDPYTTVQECESLLKRRHIFAESQGAIQNIYWNITIEAEVTQLHERIKFHNVKILALLKPLEMKLLLDIKNLVRDYGEAILAQIQAFEARMFPSQAVVQPISAETCTRCDQVKIPDFLTKRFRDASKAAKPGLESGDAFQMRDGINAFLMHHKADGEGSTFGGGFILQAPTQLPEQYLRMMKTIWIIRRVQTCSEYEDACRSGNRLLKCFVDELAQKCLIEFNRFSDKPTDPFRVRNEPTEETLNPLGEDAFMIWPKIARQLDRFDAAASLDSLKILLRAPLVNHLSPSIRMELLLLRHDNALLEMIIKETSETSQTTDSRSRDIDLKIVALSPIYADPTNMSPNIHLNLYTVGNRGRDDLLSFKAYKDLYQFQWAITGYRPVVDLLDVILNIHQDKGSEWRGRIQLWDWQGEPSRGRQNSSSHHRSSVTISSPSLPSLSNASTSNSGSRYSSTLSARSTTTQFSTITSLMESEADGGRHIESSVFELPRQPLLILFLRPSRPKTPHANHMSLMRIPMEDKSARLDMTDCKCDSTAKHFCRHSMVTGTKKFIGNKPLMVQRVEQSSEPPIVNLATLGAWHEMSGKQPEEKTNFISFTFKSPVDRAAFDNKFEKLQRLYAKNMDQYERDKVAVHFHKIQKSRP